MLLALLTTCPIKSEAFGYMSSIAAAYGDPGFVCAIKASDQQEAYCWRRNSTTADGAFDGPQNMGFSGLSGGLAIMCGLQASTSQPYCWSGNNTGLNLVPPPYATTTYSSIAAGDAHVCAVRAPPASDPGTLDCWTTTSGSSNSNSITMFPQPPAGLRVTSVVAGRTFSCGLATPAQTAVCWGSNATANAHVTDSVPPVTFQSLAAGAYHMCGIINGTGQARCWGDNSKGQAGPPSISFTALAAGFSHTCGIREDTHQVECWGNLSFNVSTTSRFLAITGGQVSCGVGEDKLIAECWGNGTAYDPPLQLFSPGLCTRSSCGTDNFYFNASAIGVRATLCSDPAQRICSPCAFTCAAGSYVSMNCSPGANLQCMPCAQCQNQQQCLAACDQGQPRSSNSAPMNGPEPNGAGLPGTGPQMATLVSGGGKPTSIGLIIGVATGGGLLVFLVGAAVTCCVLFRRRGRYLLFTCGSDSDRANNNGNNGGLVHLSSSLSSSVGSSGLGRGGHEIVIRTQAFRLTELRDATNGFKEVNELGRGSYGFVYKATLPDGRHVAVKRASAARRIHSNSRDFEAELDILCKLHHANLVNLLGYCEEMGERLLVYEYMPHGTLHDHLHGGLALLSWGLRIKIAWQAARGVEYLHKDASPRIVHKDIKSSNILLDGEWGARVADFGLSPPGGSDKAALIAAAAEPTAGYVDPEYAHSHTFTDKSDVYSFGVVLLELLCGRQVYDSGYDPPYVVDWAVPCIQQGKTVTIFDGSLELPKSVDALCRIAEIAELCVRSASCERPSMSDVAAWLEHLARSSPL